MRSKVLVTVAMAAAAASALAGVASAAGATKPLKALRLVVAIPPGSIAPPPGAASGDQFGLVVCGKPFGRGVQADSYKSSSSSTGPKVSGPYTQYFASGTIRGRFNLPFKSSGGTSLSFNGSYSVTGGTCAYDGARASGKLTCTSPDVGTHVNCTGKLAFSRI
jgi:hypothetical protein